MTAPNIPPPPPTDEKITILVPVYTPQKAKSTLCVLNMK